MGDAEDAMVFLEVMVGWEAGKLQHEISEAPGSHLAPETCVVETRGVGILLIRAPRNFGSAPSSIQSSLEACETEGVFLVSTQAATGLTYTIGRHGAGFQKSSVKRLRAMLLSIEKAIDCQRSP